MSKERFSLKPFPSASPVPDISITGDISRLSNKLAISYQLSGPMTEIMIPALTHMPVRENELFKDTCFEFFLKPVNLGQYWEFNLSPSGHWNVYHFQSYRKGMREEPVFKMLPLRIKNRVGALELALELNLDIIVPAEQSLKTAVSAVIRLIDGRLFYWALTHAGPAPDFHRAESFMIEL